MKPIQQLNLAELSREERFKIWMRREKITLTALAKHLGITLQSVRFLTRNETMPTHRHAQCLAFGIPAELLPRPFDITPGRKPKGQNSTQTLNLNA